MNILPILSVCYTIARSGSIFASSYGISPRSTRRTMSTIAVAERRIHANRVAPRRHIPIQVVYLRLAPPSSHPEASTDAPRPTVPAPSAKRDFRSSIASALSVGRYSSAGMPLIGST